MLIAFLSSLGKKIFHGLLKAVFGTGIRSNLIFNQYCQEGMLDAKEVCGQRSEISPLKELRAASIYRDWW